ncbi:CFA/I fimbrial subunit C domain protein, partial [Escherichia coli BCE011_MS-01]
MLTNFSRVEAFRNDQLLGVWYLDSGVNELDTARLPYGSYD